MARIDVVREAELHAGDSTHGITRKKAFESSGITVACTRVPRGATSAWHHHGERHLYGFLAEGRLRLEYGPGGRVVADVGRGDFFHIPPHVIHRDANPSEEQDAIIVNLLAGRGPPVLNVNGPDPS